MECKPTPLQPTWHIQWHYLGFSVGYWKHTSNVFFWDYFKQHTHQLDFICMHMSFMFSWLTCFTFHVLYIMFNCSAGESFSFFQTLVTFVNKQLIKVNLEVNDLDTQVNHLSGVSLFCFDFWFCIQNEVSMMALQFKHWWQLPASHCVLLNLKNYFWVPFFFLFIFWLYFEWRIKDYNLWRFSWIPFLMLFPLQGFLQLGSKTGTSLEPTSDITLY